MNAYQWIHTEVPNDLEVRQVYGFIFNSDGRILILEDEGKFNLPGGRPEKGENFEETLIREVLEEVQVTISLPEYLGYQLISAEEKFAQVRMIALIDQTLPTALDPGTGRQYERLLVPPIQVNGLLKWGEGGDQQIASAIALVLKLGVSWDGTSRSTI